MVWAAGEFQYPNLHSFPGSKYCLHNSFISNWDDVKGDEFFVIGGYESGMDTAINLAERNKRIIVIDKDNLLGNEEIDPSRTISPYTKDRLRRVNTENQITFHEGKLLE